MRAWKHDRKTKGTVRLYASMVEREQVVDALGLATGGIAQLKGLACTSKAW